MFALKDWLLAGVFIVGGVYAVFANIVLLFMIPPEARARIPLALGGVMAFVYFALPRNERSRACDALAITVLLSAVAAIIAALYLFPVLSASKG